MRTVFICLRLLRVDTARCTGYANGAYGSRCRGQQGQVVELQVADEDRLADTQIRNVDNQFVGEVLHQTAHTELAFAQNQFTTGLNAFRVTGQTYRNIDRYGLTRLNAIEIYMQDLFAYGVTSLASIVKCTVSPPP